MMHSLLSRLRAYLSVPVQKQLSELQRFNSTRSNQVVQRLLAATYRQAYLQQGATPQSFHDVGFRVHSQHDEDGILLYIFALIGATGHTCVELCSGNGIENNTANLILNHRWTGLLCDGDPHNVATAKRFYSSHPDTRYWPPTILQSWITRTNVNEILRSNGFSGDIDLLSLDIDGVDYWIWKELDSISPRVVVLEFNHLWGPEESVSVPYRDDFVAKFSPDGSDYAGASLMAFVKLGREKGYRLVGTNTIATNAFFVRNDIACDWLPEIRSADCFEHPRARFGISERLPRVRNMAWVEV